MFFHNSYRVHTYIPLFQCFLFLFLFFLNFSVCKLFPFFPFFQHFSLEFTLSTQNFPISSKKNCSHSAKIHEEKSLLCTEFLLFFPSEFICYDRPCKFSFSPQAPPIIATGQGNRHLHRYTQSSGVRPLKFRVQGFGL